MKEKIKKSIGYFNKYLLKNYWSQFIIIILIALLFSNYLYTFSGFVTYTETERRGCALVREVLHLETVGQRKEKYKEIAHLEENQKIMDRYAHQFITGGERCKSIQQFYIEQGFIILLGVILIYFKKKDFSEIGKK